MRNRLPWTPLALTLGLLAPGLCRAQVTLVETVGYVPTSVVALPRTYYVPTVYGTSSTSYYVPTSYYAPSRYYATSYYVPTAYSYYRRPFRRYRYFETAYLYEPTVYASPTYYVAPSAYVASSAVTTSSLCCETAATVVAAPTRSSQASVEPVSPRSAGGTIESSVAGEPDDQVEQAGSTNPRPFIPADRARGSNAGGTSSAVGSGPGATGGLATPSRGQTSTGSGTGVGEASRESRAIPSQPVPAGNTGSVGAGAGTSGGAVRPPQGTIAPADSASPPARTEPEFTPPAPIPSPAGPGNPLEFPNVSGDEAVRRSANKPVIPSLDAPRRLAQSILRGRVVSADTRMPETGVEVILIDRLGRFANRTTRTDATGRFALALPEGDWSILLTMPSGRALAVEQGVVTASAGKVSDRWGRELTNLVLSR
jgi:hypothetical protein